MEKINVKYYMLKYNIGNNKYIRIKIKKIC